MSHKCYRKKLEGNNCCVYFVSVRYYDLSIMVIPNNECLIGQYPIFMLHIFVVLVIVGGPIFSYLFFFWKIFPGKNQLIFRAELQKKSK